MKFKVIFLLFICFISCVPESSVDRTYIIRNESKANVKVHFFKEGVLSKMFVIDNEKEWSTRYKETLTDGVEATLALKSDSAIVYFDNSKVQFYSAYKKNNRNLLDNTSYVIKNKNLYTYTITETDYENATNCNDNCE